MIELIAMPALSAPPSQGADVDAALKQNKPLLVYVHAPWCSLCNELGRRLGMRLTP